MEDRGKQRSLRNAESRGDMSAVARAARCDHRQPDRARHRGRQLEVVALAGSVGVDRREQDLARTALLGFARPLRCTAPGRHRAGVRAHPPAFGVDRDDDGLRAEPVCELADQLGSGERRRVDCDLVRARLQEALAVLGRAHAAADREGDRETIGDTLHQLDERRAVADGRLDVEEHELVCARFRVRRTELDGVADVAERTEADTLHDAAACDVETGDQTGERDSASSR